MITSATSGYRRAAASRQTGEQDYLRSHNQVRHIATLTNIQANSATVVLINPVNYKTNSYVSLSVKRTENITVSVIAEQSLGTSISGMDQ